MNLQQITSQPWFPGVMDFGMRILVAIVIVIIGHQLVKWIGKLLNRMMDKPQVDVSLRKFLISVLTAISYVVVAFIAAESLGIPSASIITLLGSATLAIGLALQGSLANFAGGILILIMRPFKVGDYIVGQGTEGTVETIGLVYTTLISVDNRTVTVPNGALANCVVTNVTKQEKRRVDIHVGIAYGSNVKMAKEMVKVIYEENQYILKTEDVIVFVDDLAASSIVIGARGWTDTKDYFSAKWEILEEIQEQFKQKGIEIPFNQLDVRIRE